MSRNPDVLIEELDPASAPLIPPAHHSILQGQAALGLKQLELDRQILLWVLAKVVKQFHAF